MNDYFASPDINIIYSDNDGSIVYVWRNAP